MRPATILCRTQALARVGVVQTTSAPQPLAGARTIRLSPSFATAVATRCNFCTTSIGRSTDTSAINPDAWKVAKVPHRGVVQVSGRDTVKLLQGLVSNDVRALTKSQSESPAMVYAGFMNPQGRMLADAFIHRQADLEDGSPRWLLDVDSRTLPSLLSFIKKFKLRSKVKLVDVSAEFNIVQAWSDSSSQAPSAIVEKLSLDPRCPTIGYRGVLPSTSSLDLGATEVEGEEYTLHRIINGVGEGALDFPESSSLPLENNLDHMSGVDFRKGCYVGQELTARTHHTGVVRKRIIPLSFYLPGTPIPASPDQVNRNPPFQLPAHLTEVRSKPIGTETAAKPARGKAAGKFTSGIHNVGLGCLRLEQVQRWATAEEGKEDGLEMSILAADGETTLLVRPWIPAWWPKEPQPADGHEE
ncbi:related to IBA57 - mitochondrial iron-sulfur cluster assembly factor [Ustilago trichophora]|uniref:Related to IBA57 - mitochondrial iron-sulfur cluster assembly factor n=1 Tax=Ustilago trichophora TaxID=86804 RepID=A0A5C3EJK6_9BASI|nr:related to IBA57 - mitochondrial iron-sulfur cluster assembly factor [Ustilago trichophora]